MMTPADFDAMLQRYLDGQSRPGEQRLVEQWSAQLGQAGHQPLPPHQHAEVRAAMWQQVAARTAEPAAPVVRALWPTTLWREPALRWAAAAVLTLGAGALGWWLPRHQSAGLAQAAPQWVQQTNSSAHPTALRLADGSLVSLYPHSRLRYLTSLAGQRREVYLTGQACFKVAKDPAHPFLVYTDKLVTTVLGTSFMVTAYAHQENRVAVREGRVAVQPRDGAELTATPTHPAAGSLLLLPNQQVTYSAATRKLAKKLVAEPVLLTKEPLDFRNRPVVEVLAALEHAYGVRILYNQAKLHDCTITISFGDESLFEQLDALCTALNASYKLTDTTRVLFESPGCKASS